MSAGKRLLTAGIVLAGWTLAGCGGTSAPTPTAGPPVPTLSSSSAAPETESNPLGDIPDNQDYVLFAPPGGGFSVKIPEGWASSTAGATITFTDKLNSVPHGIGSGDHRADGGLRRANEIPQVRSTARIREAGHRPPVVQRKAGSAVLVTYHGGLPARPGTGKVVRDAVRALRLLPRRHRRRPRPVRAGQRRQRRSLAHGDRLLPVASDPVAGACERGSSTGSTGPARRRRWRCAACRLTVERRRDRRRRRAVRLGQVHAAGLPGRAWTSRTAGGSASAAGERHQPPPGGRARARCGPAGSACCCSRATCCRT